MSACLVCFRPHFNQYFLQTATLWLLKAAQLAFSACPPLGRDMLSFNRHAKSPIASKLQYLNNLRGHNAQSNTHLALACRRIIAAPCASSSSSCYAKRRRRDCRIRGTRCFYSHSTHIAALWPTRRAKWRKWNAKTYSHMKCSPSPRRERPTANLTANHTHDYGDWDACANWDMCVGACVCVCVL